jgi:methylamine dehydrogenase heavy chain
MARPLLRTVLLLALAATPAVAQEVVGKVATLPATPAPHWFWMSDVILHRTALFDADAGGLLGTISSGSAATGFVISPLFSPDHREIYLAETYYSRGVRGERTDVVTVYDTATLRPLDEIPIPPKRAEYYMGVAANALSDDGRFMGVFNLTPAQSLTVVDVKARRFTAEVPTPGCSLAYAAGDRRFLMLCADGSALRVRLDDGGQPAGVDRTERFFDAEKDPITEKAARLGTQWLFVSFEGVVHPVDVSVDPPRFGETWPLFTDDDRRSTWRIGGQQHLAVHARSGRLYALVHRGGADSHKQAGTEVWVYDVAARRRVQRIPMLNPLAAFVRQEGHLGGTTEWVLAKVFPHTGVDGILVTQDEHPVLVAAATLPPTVTVHDATSGAVVREIDEVGLGASLLAAP